MATSIPFSGMITTSAPSDTYAVTDTQYGIDGLRSVANVASRDAITTERRREGMMVFTRSTSQYWGLGPAPWTGTASDWKLLEFGSGAPASSQQFDFLTPTTDWIMNHTLGGYPSVSTTDLSWSEIMGTVSYPSTSQVIVHHDIPNGQAGHAILRSRG